MNTCKIEHRFYSEKPISDAIMILVAFLFPGPLLEVAIDHESECRGKNEQDKKQEDERWHKPNPFCIIQLYVCLNMCGV